MKYILQLSLVLLVPGFSFAQSNADSTQRPADSSQIFNFVELMPVFPEGNDKIAKYLAEHIHYPDSARLNGIQGKVIVKFVVDEMGNVSDATIIKSLGWGCDEEALRVVKSMPQWKPGRLVGMVKGNDKKAKRAIKEMQRKRPDENESKPIKVYFNLPVTFHLEDKTDKRKRNRTD